MAKKRTNWCDLMIPNPEHDRQIEILNLTYCSMQYLDQLTEHQDMMMKRIKQYSESIKQSTEKILEAVEKLADK